MTWRDVTTYSKGCTERIPSVLECKLDGNIIVQLHTHLHYGDEWLLTSQFFNFDKVCVGETELDLAKSKAKEMIYEALLRKQREIENELISLRVD